MADETKSKSDKGESDLSKYDKETLKQHIISEAMHVICEPDLSTWIKSIEDIQNNLNQLSNSQIMQELETIKIWMMNKR